MFYLARYVQGQLGDTGLCYFPVGADLTDKSWWSIDLRPPGQDTGFALLRTQESVSASTSLITLSDDPDDTSQLIAQRLSNRLGITIDPETRLRRLLMALLLKYGDDANPNRWNQLKASRNGRFELWLGELLSIVPVVQGGAVLTESFNKADSTVLGPDQVWTETRGDLEVFSNQVRMPAAATSTAGFARAEADLATADHYAQISYVSQTSANDRIGPTLRYNPANSQCYWFWGRQNVSTTYRISKMSTTGTETAITSVSVTPITLPALLRGEVSGSTITGYDTGVSVVTATDTTIVGFTRCGVGIITLALGDVPAADNWEAGDLSGAAPQTVSPTGITSVGAIGSSVLKTSTKVLPSGIASLEVVGTASVAAGARIVQPIGIISAEAFGVDTVKASTKVLPIGIASVQQFGAVNVAEASFVRPIGLPSSEAFGQPTMLGGLFLILYFEFGEPYFAWAFSDAYQAWVFFEGEQAWTFGEMTR